MDREDELWAYVGTYTKRGSEGIYIYRMDASSGDLALLGVASGVENPSFLALDPQRRYLYAVNEVDQGTVSAFAVDRESGALRFLNRQSSHGAAPCHLSVDQTGRYVLVANYTSGSVAVLPIQADGRLSEASDWVQHRGSSVHPRQQGPHAHSITLDPANRLAFAADLGLDRILVYALDLQNGTLAPHRIPWIEVHTGAGPRHLSFHPNGRYAYVIDELDNTVVAFGYDPVQGTLRTLQTLPTLPQGFDGTSYCADVHLTPSGEFLYGSNRGHDSIAAFAVSEQTGQLTPLGHYPTQGRNPRNFAIDPSGTYLLAANQDSDSIVVFGIEPQSGELQPTGHVTQVPMPVCIQIVPSGPARR
jgi:6-phosphogluconolactonase